MLLSPQLPLDLRPRGKRGGARPGAGRPKKKESERKLIAHRERALHRKWDPVHVTLRVKRHLPSLRTQQLEKIVKLALLAQRKELAARHREAVAQREKRGEGGAHDEGSEKGPQHFQVVHFTIQNDHLHLIVEAPTKGALAGGVMGLEIRIARRINKELGRKGRFWADRYHRRDLRAKRDMRNVLRYVLLNTQKHHPVIGDRCFADPHSSAATFDGFARSPLVFDDRQRWPRVDPRTWLLGVGWREHGLIDPTDTPPSSPHRH